MTSLSASILVLVSSLAVPFAAQATGSGMSTMGADASVVSMGQLFLSSPLPSLDSGRFMVTIQAGMSSIEASNDNAAELDAANPGSQIRYRGETKGFNAGLAFAVPIVPDLGVYLFLVGSQSTGDYADTVNGALSEKLGGISARSMGAAAGVNYRLIGDDISTFALGVYGGPAYYSLQSSSDYQDVTAGSALSSVSFNPSGVGLLGGIQAVFRYRGFRLNPYITGFGELAGACKRIDVGTGGPLDENDFMCGGNAGYYGTSLGFVGAGVVLGYGPFRASLASMNSQVPKNLKTTTFMFSYGMGL